MPETNKPKWLDRAKESSYVMWKRIIGPDEGKVGFESVDLDVLLPRQGYKESTFLDKNVKGKNSAGAIGIAQVKQRTLKDYPELKGVNLRDPKQGVGAQKVIMDDLLNADFIDKPYQPDSVTAAKALGAYNWGRGNLSAYLNAQKKKGVDIYDTWDWLEGLPKETEDYINKVLRGKDQKFEKNFDRAKKHPYMKFYRSGGVLKAQKGTAFHDFGSRMLHGLQTFGGSYVGDFIQGINPKAAEAVSKYTAGMVSPTPQSYLEGNRGSWNNRISNAENAVSMVLAGEVAGPILQKVITPIKKAIPIINKSLLYSAPPNSYRPISENFWNDMIQASKTGVLDSRNFVKNPIVQETIKHNQNLAIRLRPNMYVNKELNKDVIKFSERKMHPEFFDFGKGSKEAAMNLDSGDNVRILFNSNAENAILPLEHHISTGFHEGLHTAKFGAYPAAKLKLSKLYKPKNQLLKEGHSDDFIDYILDNPNGEGVVNTIEIGKRLRLTPGQTYIGKEPFNNLLKNTNLGIKQGMESMFKLDTPRDYKRVWDAVTGKYLTVPAAAVATQINNN